MEMFGRKNTKTDSFESRESVEVQVDFGSRTCATNTEIGLARTVGSITDDILLVDREVAMDVLPSWDAAVQFAPASREIGIDPGEWNSTVLHGVDAQTEVQDLHDPLFWFTGSSLEVNTVITSLLNLLSDYHLGESPQTYSHESLKLNADNTLLRIEVAELKRKLNTPSRVLLGGSESWTLPNRASAGLTGGYSTSTTYEVIHPEGVSVTSSLGPSSFALGRLKFGDKILTSGCCEEILGEVRAPIFPRGWVTLRNGDRSFMKKR